MCVDYFQPVLRNCTFLVTLPKTATLSKTGTVILNENWKSTYPHIIISAML